MARSQSYNHYEDFGLAFTDREVAEYDLDYVIERRMERLIEIHNILYAMAQIPGGNTVTPGKMAKQAKEMATGIVAFSSDGAVEAPDQSDFYTLDKEYVLAAQNIDCLYHWTRALRAETELWVQYHVTIGRRCQNWKRPQISKANKMINQGQNQIRTIDFWLAKLIVLPNNCDCLTDQAVFETPDTPDKPFE